MVQQVSMPKPGEEPEKAACRHHWIIETPIGPVSSGVCQVCGEIREFKNYIETAPWRDTVPATHLGDRYPSDSSPEDPDDLEDF